MKENEIKCTTSKIKECERIKEEEKNDRLAIANEKRKRYGLKRLNKEENMRIKKRTEERLELAQAKANYWKWYRGGGREMIHCKSMLHYRRSFCFSYVTCTASLFDVLHANIQVWYDVAIRVRTSTPYVILNVSVQTCSNT